MPDTTTDTTDDATDEAREATDAAEVSTDDARVTKANSEAARYRKELRAAQAELDKVRRSGLSEQEKAVAEAKAAGQVEAVRAVVPRLVRAEFRAAAAGQVDKSTLDAYLEDIDLSKFVTEDGEPDTKAIESRIKRLGGGRAADFDGGARTPAGKPGGMNSQIRRMAGLG